MPYSIGQEIRPSNDVPTGAAPGSASFAYGRLSPTAPGKVKGVRTVNGKTYYDIDQTYIGGGTGWVDASLVDNPSPPPAQPSYSTPTSSQPAPSPASSSMPRSDYVNQLIAQFQKEDAARAATSEAARKKLMDYYAGLEDPTVRYQRLREEQGVGAQQTLVDALTKDVMSNQDLIDDMEGSVNQRSGDFLINEGQRTALLARERYPLEQNLTKLLRQKQYEEVGLAGKQQLVQELLQLSLKNDEMKAKPLQLGVDYSKEDRDTARSIFADLATRSTNAYSADLTAADDRQKAIDDRAFQDRKMKEQFANDIALENLRTQNDIEKYNATTGTNKSSTESKAKAKDDASRVYNQLIGNSKSEYEIWKKLMDSREKYSALGIMDELWDLHGAFKANLSKQNNYL